MMFFEWIPLYFIFLQIVKVIAPQPYEVGVRCDRNRYGRPIPEDCKSASKWIPYSASWRQFVAPEFMDPRFGAVSNAEAPTGIVQLPKIWRHSECSYIKALGGCTLWLMFEPSLESCTIALVLQPYNTVYAGERIKAVLRFRWSDVSSQVDKLLGCLSPKGGGPAEGGFRPLVRKS